MTRWSTFLKAHWDSLAAADFFTAEVWTRGGLVTYYVLVVMELSTRRSHCAGTTTSPGAAWMVQLGRNLTDVVMASSPGSGISSWTEIGSTLGSFEP